MIKIWRYRQNEPWQHTEVNLDPDLNLEEFLKEMKIPKEPLIVLGDSFTTLTVFKDSNSIYYVSIEIQELHEIIILENLSHLLIFLKDMGPLMLCFADMMRSFGDED